MRNTLVSLTVIALGSIFTTSAHAEATGCNQISKVPRSVTKEGGGPCKCEGGSAQVTFNSPVTIGLGKNGSISGSVSGSAGGPGSSGGGEVTCYDLILIEPAHHELIDGNKLVALVSTFSGTSYAGSCDADCWSFLWGVVQGGSATCNYTTSEYGSFEKYKVTGVCRGAEPIP
ncbi:MAG: hypothetical protein KDD53_02305 [Bdellovibrionales bacterium]|nr:hypothetical protein [Bdellovibrionales bacterium]